MPKGRRWPQVSSKAIKLVAWGRSWGGDVGGVRRDGEGHCCWLAWMSRQVTMVGSLSKRKGHNLLGSQRIPVLDTWEQQDPETI